MLPKEYRLKKRSAFKATYKTGNTLYSGGITAFCGRKKIHKRAVKRNRIKRLMRESYRLAIKNRTLSKQYMSVIFVASSKLLEKDFKYIDTHINKLADKL